MATIAEAYAIALQHHQAGRLQAAERVYRLILQAQPDHADALHLLGLVHAQTGRYQVAIEFIARALTVRPDWAEAQINLGNALREQGRLDEAVVVLRRAVQLKPDHAAAHNNLGNALACQGKRDDAIGCYRRALELRPDFAEAQSNLGNALRARGDLDEAVACYRRAVDLRPDFAEAHYNLGVVLSDLGRSEEAAGCYRQAVALRPAYVEAHNNLGNVLKGQGNRDGAIACYRRALELRPDHAAAHNNLGLALGELGRSEEAVACHRLAVELRPDFAEAHNNLGLALSGLGKPEEAISCYRRALELRPDHAEAHNNLGNAFRDLEDPEGAVACYRRALDLKPDYVEAQSNLGNALRGRGDLEEAVACYRRALDLRPDYAEALGNLGNALRDQGDAEGAVACYRRALDLKPDQVAAHSNLLYTLHYCRGITPEALAEAHAEYDRRHAAPLHVPAVYSGEIVRVAGPCRLGFVSPDLGRHPVGYFLVRVLENLGHRPFEIICYSDRLRKDGLTRRLEAASTRWRDVRGLGDDRLAEQIRADRVDILFDLAGHTAANRLLVFARKPAPIQITWIGYEGTTGMAAMDYLIADRRMVPEGSERYYRERILRMPDGYLCYDPPEAAPPVEPPPCLKRGFATFGSFHNPAKITPEVVEVWARILREAAGTRLLMKYRGLGDRVVKGRFLDLFASHGVEAGRLDFVPWSSYSDYLATYRQVDVVLDTFPFSGSTTTCESLWMGVPVVTLPGETFASRHGLGHLSGVGLAEMIPRDVDDYINRAVSLAGDATRLAELRAGLRERMAASPLCDGRRFASQLAALLDEVWDRHRG